MSDQQNEGQLNTIQETQIMSSVRNPLQGSSNQKIYTSSELKSSTRNTEAALNPEQIKFKIKPKDFKLKNYYLHSNHNMPTMVSNMQMPERNPHRERHLKRQNQSKQQNSQESLDASIERDKRYQGSLQKTEEKRSKQRQQCIFEHEETEEAKVVKPKARDKRRLKKGQDKGQNYQKKEEKQIYHNPRQSHSQSKKDKINHNSYNRKAQNENIFCNDPGSLIFKQQSYHSLERGELSKRQSEINAKVEQKIHLPLLNSTPAVSQLHQKNNTSLLSNQKLISKKKIVKYSQIRQVRDTHNQTIDRLNHQEIANYGGEGKDAELTKSKSKLVKIPVERLKQLKPEEIKLKFERKVREEQKNRAKEMAIQIFNRDEQASQQLLETGIMHSALAMDDENFHVHGRNSNILLSEAAFW